MHVYYPVEKLGIFDLGPNPAHVAERETAACLHDTLHQSGNVPQFNIELILERYYSFEYSIQISASQRKSHHNIGAVWDKSIALANMDAWSWNSYGG